MSDDVRIGASGESASGDGTTGQTGSWRDAVSDDAAVAKKRQRAAERSKRLMSDLWSRLFPIDYDAIPLAEYVVIGVPDLGGSEPLGEEASPEGELASLAAVVAAKDEASRHGMHEGIASDTPVMPAPSDTSDENAVMIGNAALSEMLSGTAGNADDTAAWAVGSEVSTLYDEAMDALSAPVPVAAPAAAASNMADAGEDAKADETSDKADGEANGQTDHPDEPSGIEGDGVLNSDEWREIESSIDAASRAMAAELTGTNGAEIAHEELTAAIETENAASDETTETDEPEMTEAEPVDGNDEPESETGEAGQTEPNKAEASEESDAQAAVSDGEALGEAMPEASDGESQADATEETAKKPVARATEGAIEEAPGAEIQKGERHSLRSVIERLLGLLGIYRRDDGPDEPQAAGQGDETNRDDDAQALPVASDDDKVGETDLETTEALDAQVMGEATEASDDDPIVIGDGYRVGDYEVSETDDTTVLDREAVVDIDDGPIRLADELGEGGAATTGQTVAFDAQDAAAEDLSEATRPLDAHDIPTFGPQETVPLGDAFGETVAISGYETTMPAAPQTIEPHGRRAGTGVADIDGLLIDASPELMVDLPTSPDGHVSAVVRMRETDFLKPRSTTTGGRSSHVRLSVRPSQARIGELAILPEGTGRLPVESPVGTHPKERVSYDIDLERLAGRAV